MRKAAQTSCTRSAWLTRSSTRCSPGSDSWTSSPYCAATPRSNGEADELIAILVAAARAARTR
jgi:hypothetical protein